MRTVSTAEVATAEDAREELPERVQEALGELAGAAKEGLMALSVGVGLGVWPSAGPCVGGPWLVPLRLSARVTSLRSAPQHRAPRTVLLLAEAVA